MSKREPDVILKDITDNMDSILDFVGNITFEEFCNDLKTQYAVDRCFEIIGEASKQLPEEFTKQHLEIEWHKMMAFRNLLIHEYFKVERKIEWNIIKNILPDLLVKIKALS
jgi:uncharacterized protein with HEPN domain